MKKPKPRVKRVPAEQTPDELAKFKDGVTRRMKKKLHDVCDKELLRQMGIKTDA